MSATEVQNLDNFYGTTATILSAIVIAGVLELRWYREFTSNREGYVTSRTYRLLLSLFAVVMTVAALGLASIPSAVIGDGTDWYNEPETLVSLTSAAGAIAFILPLGTFLALIWGKMPEKVHRVEIKAPLVTPPLVPSTSASRFKALLAALLFGIVLVHRQRRER